MDTIKRINHVGLRVKDLGITRAFYEKLGFIFIVGPTGPEPVAIMEHPSGVNINFILNGDPASAENVLMDQAVKHTGYTHMALEVDDLGPVQAYLAQNEIAISEGPITVPEGVVLLFIRDPDSNVIEFHQPAPQ